MMLMSTFPTNLSLSTKGVTNPKSGIVHSSLIVPGIGYPFDSQMMLQQTRKQADVRLRLDVFFYQEQRLREQ